MERIARIPLLIAAAMLAIGVTSAWGRVDATRAEGLVRAFGDGVQFDPHTVYLEPAEVDSVQVLAQSPLRSAHVTYWVATRDDTVLGTAFLETFTVRTMPATLLVAVQPDGRVIDVRVLAFHEPEDYRPPAAWLAWFRGHVLSHHLRPGDAVDGVTGATISARTFSACVRRSLALAHVLAGRHR